MSLTKEILKSNFSIRVKTKGCSMLPFIRTCDYVTIKPIKIEAVRIGDILAYLNNNHDKIICHRLVKRKGSFLITKGDIYLGTHEEVSLNSLLGKIISVERGRKKLNLENKFQKLLALWIAWVSLYFPLLLFIIACLAEALRSPRLVLIKMFRKIRQYQMVFSWPIIIKRMIKEER